MVSTYRSSRYRTNNQCYLRQPKHREAETVNKPDMSHSLLTSISSTEPFHPNRHNSMIYGNPPETLYQCPYLFHNWLTKMSSSVQIEWNILKWIVRSHKSWNENLNFITWSVPSLPPFASFTNQFMFRNGNHLVYINRSSNEVGLLVIRILGYLIILKHRNNQSCSAAQAGGGNHNLYFNLFIFQHAMMFPCRELCLDGGNININISGSSGLSRSAKFFTEMNPCSKLKPWCTSIKECLRFVSSFNLGLCK